MPRVDLSRYLDEELVLAYRGTDYTVPSPDAKTGLALQSMLNVSRKIGLKQDITDQDAASVELDDEAEANFYQRILGAAYDEMVRDGVPFQALKGMALYAWGHFSESAETGQRLMEFSTSGAPSGEVPAPNRRSRRAASKSSQASTDSGRTTQKPVSTNGSSSSKKNRATVPV